MQQMSEIESDRHFKTTKTLSCLACVSQEAKVKKIMSKKDRREKKMFSSKDDERFLLTGEKLADRKG